MTKNLFVLLCLVGLFTCCSTNKGLLKKHNYAKVINEATFHLSCNANDHRAGFLLQKAYSEALIYYQNEIDSILTSKDPFKWTTTLQLMQQTNDLSDEILYNSAALQLICDPKIYTNELFEVNERAVTELYGAGVYSLSLHTKQKAKEAWYYFTKAAKLHSGYKDVILKIQESKDLATYNVIIDPVPAHIQYSTLSFSTKKFYETMFYMLRQKFPSDGFVIFYTSEDALKEKIENPDLIVTMEISDFEIRSYSTVIKNNSWNVPLKRLEMVDGKYGWKKVENNSSPGPTGSVQPTPEHKQAYTRLEMKGNIALIIDSSVEDLVVYKERIPCNYTEEIYHSYSYTINQSHVSLSPDNQNFFDHFSLSECDQVVDRLTQFFKQYN